MTAGVLTKRSKTHKRLNTWPFLIRQNKTKCTLCLVLNAHFVLLYLIKKHSVSPLCAFDPISLNGLSLPHWNAPLSEFLGWRVLVLALGLLEICPACSVYWVTDPAGLCNKKLIYTPGSQQYCKDELVNTSVFCTDLRLEFGLKTTARSIVLNNNKN